MFDFHLLESRTALSAEIFRLFVSDSQIISLYVIIFNTSIQVPIIEL